MAKYQALFLEEATEHLAEFSTALLALEKDTSSVESIDTIFRMAHSIKSMAASLGYDSVTELAHRLEDRLQTIRAEGRVRGDGELSLLFEALETLEGMVRSVAESAQAPPASAELLAALASAEDAQKKVRT